MSRAGSPSALLVVDKSKGAASILHCRSGERPAYEIVPCWPSQSKNPELPTKILYNLDGRCVAVGGETKDTVYERELSEGRLTEVEGFKLLLCEQVQRRRVGSSEVGKRDQGFDPPSYGRYEHSEYPKDTADISLPSGVSRMTFEQRAKQSRKRAVGAEHD